MPLSLTLHSHLWRSAALLIACQLPNQRSCKTTRLNWRSLFVIVIWSWQNGKQYFEEINVYFVINGDLFENWLFAFEASSITIWNIKHDQLDTDLQDYALTWGDKFITKQDLKASVDALVKHIVTYLWNQRFLTQKCVNTAFLSRKCVNTAFLSRKFVNTAFLSRKFVNTRSSIAFKDMLRSSIAPQIVLHWIRAFWVFPISPVASPSPPIPNFLSPLCLSGKTSSQASKLC